MSISAPFEHIYWQVKRTYADSSHIHACTGLESKLYEPRYSTKGAVMVNPCCWEFVRVLRENSGISHHPIRSCSSYVSWIPLAQSKWYCNLGWKVLPQLSRSKFFMRMKPKALAEWKEELSKEAVMQDLCPTWDEETPLPWMIGVHAGGLNSLCGKTRICMKGASICFSFRSLGTTYPWPIGSTKRQSYAHIRIKVGSPTVLSPMGAADGNSNISFRTTKVHIFIDKYPFR